MIRGSIVNLRKITRQDLELLRNWRNSTDIRKYNSQFLLLNLMDQTRWFKQISKESSGKIMFMITDKKMKPIGVCGLINLNITDRFAEIAIIIGEKKMWGKGFGSESLQLLVHYGFSELKLHRLEARIFDFNKSSIRLFEKLGFMIEVNLRESLWREGKWWDVHIFSILNNDHSPNIE